MPNWQSRRLRPDNQTYEPALSVTTNGAGKFTVAVQAGGDGPDQASVNAQMVEAIQGRFRQLLADPAYTGAQAELERLEKNKVKLEGQLKDHVRQLQEITAKKASYKLDDPEYPTLLAGCQRAERAVKQADEDVRPSLEQIVHRQAELRRQLRQARELLAEKVVAEVKAELVAERDRRMEALLKAIGKPLDGLVDLATKLTGASQAGLVKALADLAPLPAVSSQSAA